MPVLHRAIAAHRIELRLSAFMRPGHAGWGVGERQQTGHDVTLGYATHQRPAGLCTGTSQGLNSINANPQVGKTL